MRGTLDAAIEHTPPTVERHATHHTVAPTVGCSEIVGEAKTKCRAAACRHSLTRR